MPRKGHIAKRTVEPDPVYGSDLVTKFVNSMMWPGKKSTAEGIFYEAMTRLQTKGGDEALKLFKKAVENAKPLLEVKIPPRGRRQLSGAGGSECRSAHFAGDPLAGDVLPRSRGKGNDRQVEQRIARRRQRQRRGHQEERRRAPHGRSEQGLCALSVVGKQLSSRLASALASRAEAGVAKASG